jgi:hypothetical protein
LHFKAPQFISFYNRPMRFLADPRRRSIALLTGGAVLVFVLLGTLNWFNTSKVDFLNPATYAQTMVLTALELLLFLLLLLLMVLLFRTVLKVYVGQGSSGVGARLRSRMVIGAVIITFMPAVLMAIFSYLLLNRSLERWFSPDASQLRDDADHGLCVSSPACGWRCSSPSRSRGPWKRWPTPWTRLPRQVRAARGGIATGEMGDLVRSFQPHGGRS